MPAYFSAFSARGGSMTEVANLLAIAGADLLVTGHDDAGQVLLGALLVLVLELVENLGAKLEAVFNSGQAHFVPFPK